MHIPDYGSLNRRLQDQEGIPSVILGARFMFKMFFGPWFYKKQTNSITKNDSLHTLKSLISKKMSVFCTVGLHDTFI